MTTKKELLQKIAELQAQADAMPDEFKIETVRAYEPLEKGQRYCFVYAEGDVDRPTWDNDLSDRSLLNTGQVFLSTYAAEREAKRRQLWHKCRKAMRDAWEAFGEMPDWTEDSQVKYCAYIAGYRAEYAIYRTEYKRIHFPTRDSLDAWRSTVTDYDIKIMLIEEW